PRDEPLLAWRIRGPAVALLDGSQGAERSRARLVVHVALPQGRHGMVMPSAAADAPEPQGAATQARELAPAQGPRRSAQMTSLRLLRPVAVLLAVVALFAVGAEAAGANQLVTITIPDRHGEIPAKWLTYPGAPRA